MRTKGPKSIIESITKAQTPRVDDAGQLRGEREEGDLTKMIFFAKKKYFQRGREKGFLGR